MNWIQQLWVSYHRQRWPNSSMQFQMGAPSAFSIRDEKRNKTTFVIANIKMARVDSLEEALG